MSGPFAHTRWGLVPAADAGLDATDTGLRGDGVFTTVLVRGTSPLWLDEHLTRVTSDAATLGIAAPPAAWLATACRTVVAANDGQFATTSSALRVTVTRGAASPDAPFGAPVGPASVLVTQHALEPGPEPAPAVVRAVTVGWSRALAGVKHTSWLAASEALRHARTAGADTALLTRPDPAGHAADDLVLEGATANLLLVDTAGAVVTPPADGSLLPGITRATVLDLTRASGLVVEERHVRRAEVSRAAEALLTSSLRGVTALTHVDGVAVGDGTAGEVTTRLAALWEAEATRRTAGGG